MPLAETLPREVDVSLGSTTSCIVSPGKSFHLSGPLLPFPLHGHSFLLSQPYEAGGDTECVGGSVGCSTFPQGLSRAVPTSPGPQELLLVLGGDSDVCTPRERRF